MLSIFQESRLCTVEQIIITELCSCKEMFLGRTFNYYEDEDLLSIVSLSSSEKTINSRACEFETPKTFSKTSSLSSGKKSVSLSTLRSWDPEDGMLIRYDSKPHLQG